jgi:hypothetical protein
MAANPRVVATDITVNWDGGTTFVRRGTVVDIPAGSALETAYGGPSNLVSFGGASMATGDDPGESEPPDEEGGASLWQHPASPATWASPPRARMPTALPGTSPAS